MSSTLETRRESVTLDVAGMHCEGCVRAVTRAASAVPGVVVDQVGLGRCTVFVEPGTPAAERLIEAIRAVGYEARIAS